MSIKIRPLFTRNHLTLFRKPDLLGHYVKYYYMVITKKLFFKSFLCGLAHFIYLLAKSGIPTEMYRQFFGMITSHYFPMSFTQMLCFFTVKLCVLHMTVTITVKDCFLMCGKSSFRQHILFIMIFYFCYLTFFFTMISTNRLS